MRFVAKYQRYAIQVRPQKEIVTIDGVPMVAQTQIICEFEQAALQPHEIDAAVRFFRFTGLPDGLDATYRLSAFDTEWLGWDDSTREEVEHFLTVSPSNGVDFFEVEEPKVVAPWPNYDQLLSPKRIAHKVREDGFDIDTVIAFERQNQDREDVIAALEDLKREAPAEAEIAA